MVTYYIPTKDKTGNIILFKTRLGLGTDLLMLSTYHDCTIVKDEELRLAENLIVDDNGYTLKKENRGIKSIGVIAESTEKEAGMTFGPTTYSKIFADDFMYFISDNKETLKPLIDHIFHRHEQAEIHLEYADEVPIHISNNNLDYKRSLKNILLSDKVEIRVPHLSIDEIVSGHEVLRSLKEIFDKIEKYLEKCKDQVIVFVKTDKDKAYVCETNVKKSIDIIKRARNIDGIIAGVCGSRSIEDATRRYTRAYGPITVVSEDFIDGLLSR